MKNEPAFPTSEAILINRHVEGPVSAGLTKRELFAAMLWTREIPKRSLKYAERPAERAKRAVEHADALIDALEQK